MGILRTYLITSGISALVERGRIAKQLGQTQKGAEPMSRQERTSLVRAATRVKLNADVAKFEGFLSRMGLSSPMQSRMIMRLHSVADSTSKLATPNTVAATKGLLLPVRATKAVVRGTVRTTKGLNRFVDDAIDGLLYSSEDAVDVAIDGTKAGVAKTKQVMHDAAEGAENVRERFAAWRGLRHAKSVIADAEEHLKEMRGLGVNYPELDVLEADLEKARRNIEEVDVDAMQAIMKAHRDRRVVEVTIKEGGEVVDVTPPAPKATAKRAPSRALATA